MRAFVHGLKPHLHSVSTLRERNQCFLSLAWGIREVITTRYDEAPQRVIDVPKFCKNTKERLSPGSVGDLHGGDIQAGARRTGRPFPGREGKGYCCLAHWPHCSKKKTENTRTSARQGPFLFHGRTSGVNSSGRCGRLGLLGTQKASILLPIPPYQRWLTHHTCTV